MRIVESPANGAQADSNPFAAVIRAWLADARKTLQRFQVTLKFLGIQIAVKAYGRKDIPARRSCPLATLEVLTAFHLWPLINQLGHYRIIVNHPVVVRAARSRFATSPHFTKKVAEKPEMRSRNPRTFRRPAVIPKLGAGQPGSAHASDRA